MKKIIFFLGLIALSATAFAAYDYRNASFSIDWNNPQSLNQDQSIYCQYAETAAVIITAPGIFNHDFTVNGPGGSCKVAAQKRHLDAEGKMLTTVIFRGADCFSDNDQNFFVDEKGTGKEAALTADSGC